MRLSPATDARAVHQTFSGLLEGISEASIRTDPDTVWRDLIRRVRVREPTAVGRRSASKTNASDHHHEALSGVPPHLRPRVVPLEEAIYYPQQRPPLSTHVRIVCISDTHNFHSKPLFTSNKKNTAGHVKGGRDLRPSIPICDILVHAGDFTDDGTAAEARAFTRWLRTAIPWVGAKVVVAGNHDMCFDGTLKGAKKEGANGGTTVSNAERTTSTTDFWASMEGVDDTISSAHSSRTHTSSPSSTYCPRADLMSVPNCTYLEHEAVAYSRGGDGRMVPAATFSRGEEGGTASSSATSPQLTLFGSPYTPQCFGGSCSTKAPGGAFEVARGIVALAEGNSVGSPLAAGDKLLAAQQQLMEAHVQQPSRWPLDILITHGPPLGVGDKGLKGKHGGCADLMDWILHCKPRLHIFGHFHGGYGVYANENTLFVNASSCDSKCDGRRMNDPVVIDLPLQQ